MKMIILLQIILPNIPKIHIGLSAILMAGSATWVEGYKEAKF